MRKLVLPLLISFLFSLPALAQNEGISFQGLARNAAGEVLVSQKITLRLSILLGSESGAVAYTETREAMTNPQGIFSLVVGDGNANDQTGSFSNIDWGMAPKFIKVEMAPDAGLNFTAMGTSKLQPVPVAYYAYGVDAENVQGLLPVGSGGTGVASISALKTNLGLDQVNNTSDANKPLSVSSQAALGTKVDKVTGKELSTNDYSTAEKTKLAAITGTNTGDQDLSGYATSAQLASKANAADVTTSLASKVDKEIGKGLSSNDYTTDEKTKLAAITGNVAGPQGIQGLPGAAGVAGPIGLTGLTGATGPAGVAGAQGLTGAMGTNGKTVSNGITDPLSSTGVDGDFYINTATNTLFGPKASGAWPIGFSLIGAMGPSGSQGPTGATGAQGIQGLTGPQGPQGVAGPAGNNGVAGAPGAQGVAGVTGTQGPIGYTGPQGAKGDTGLLSSGNAAGNTPYWDGSQWVVNNSNLYNNGSNLGIGTITPTEKLDVVGNLKTSGTFTAGTVTYPNTHNTTAGQVLTTDALGVASWGTLTSIIPTFQYGTANTLINGSSNPSPNLTTGRDNTGYGTGVFNELTEGSYNSAFGTNALSKNTTGGFSTASGYYALSSNIGGGSNTASGYFALGSNTSGSYNTAIGNEALFSNVSGSSNTAVGRYALKTNTVNDNTAFGFQALYANSTGLSNTANGSSTLVNNKTGNYNTASGSSAMSSNTDGDNNTASGTAALGSNLTGDNNTAMGYRGLWKNTDGQNNIAIGTNAGTYITDGTTANTTGDKNVFIGNSAKAKLDNDQNEIVIGYDAIGAGSNTVQLGNSAITAVRLGTTTAVTLETGAIKLTGGSPAVGKILTSDANGLASWETPSASGVPYTGANAAVNLGAYDLTVNGITIGKSSGLASTKMGQQALASDVGYGNHAFGYQALKSITGSSSNYNNAFGFQALTANTTGSMNTAIGSNALDANLTGNYNSAFGSNALGSNVSGGYNLALGSSALSGNISAYYNVAVGQEALVATSSGNYNTALGFRAGNLNTTGTNNTLIGYDSDVNSANLTNATAIGAGALVSTSNTIQLGNTAITNVKTSGTFTAGTVTYPNAHGSANQVLTTNGSGTLTWATPSGATSFNSDITVNGITVGKGGGGSSTNTVLGSGSLTANTTAYQQTAIGYNSLPSNGGFWNTSIGSNALYSLVDSPTAVRNTAVGAYALNLSTSGGANTAVGGRAGQGNKTGYNNVFVGYDADHDYGQDGSFYNVIVIGFNAKATKNNQITLGNGSITELRAQVTSITSLSDRRDKTDIITLTEGLDFLKQLNPVSFTWNTRDKAKVGIKSAGFIAQDLLALQQKSTIGDNLDLVSHENPDKFEARYSNLLPVIVKAIQEESAQKDNEIAALKALLKSLEARLESLETTVNKK